MADKETKPDGSEGRKPHPLVAIRQKLERILHSRGGASAYRTEVVSIIDALDAVNRDMRGLQGRLHRGERDVD